MQIPEFLQDREAEHRQQLGGPALCSGATVYVQGADVLWARGCPASTPLPRPAGQVCPAGCPRRSGAAPPSLPTRPNPRPMGTRPPLSAAPRAQIPDSGSAPPPGTAALPPAQPPAMRPPPGAPLPSPASFCQPLAGDHRPHSGRKGCGERPPAPKGKKREAVPQTARTKTFPLRFHLPRARAPETTEKDAAQ